MHTQEDEQLLECHRKHGNKWTLIAQEIGGRTDNAVKNRWAALEKKRRPGDEGYGGSQGRSSYSGRGDLLAVRRIIAKDQPQRSYGAGQHQHQQQVAGLLDAAWMQDSLGQSAAAAAAAAQQQQQQHEQQQAAYTMQPAAFGGQPGTTAGAWSCSL